METGEVNPALVCKECLEKNLVETIVLSHCSQCSQIFCIHSASTNDPMFCNVCLADLTIKIEPVPETSPRANVIKYSGASWLFISRRIKILTDTELALGIEYHRGILQQMLAERDLRRVEGFQRQFNGAKFKDATVNLPSNVVVTNKPPKIKKEKKDNTEKALKLLADLMKNGMTIEDIKLMASMKN